MQMPMEKMEENATEASTLLKAISNQTRLMIVCQLVEKEMSVGELLESIPLSQSAMSQHLSILRREKIVKTRREAQSIYYSLDSAEARAILETLYNLYCGPDD
jgi:DNA-binding transcriptional ArsR family regulator